MIMPTPKAPELAGLLSFCFAAAAGICAAVELPAGNLGVAGWALASAWLALRLGHTQRDLAKARHTRP